MSGEAKKELTYPIRQFKISIPPLSHDPQVGILEQLVSESAFAPEAAHPNKMCAHLMEDGVESSLLLQVLPELPFAAGGILALRERKKRRRMAQSCSPLGVVMNRGLSQQTFA